MSSSTVMRQENIRQQLTLPLILIYHYSIFSTGAVANSYDVEISTDNPGGGQSLSYIDVVMNNLTNVTIEMNGLVVGDNYQYDYYRSCYVLNNSHN